MCSVVVPCRTGGIFHQKIQFKLGVAWASPGLLQCQRRWILNRSLRKPPPPGKPPCLPPAKTKRYQVIHPEWMEPEDVRELLWRRHAYMHALSSIRAQFRREVEAQSHGEGSIEDMMLSEREEFEGILKKNEEHNHQLAQKRAERDKEELRKLEEETLAEIEKFVQSQAEDLRQKEAEVERVKVEEKNFVVAENLEQRILQCLENPGDHNFAIDVEGHSYSSGKLPTKYLTSLPSPKQKYLYEETARIVRMDEKSSEEDQETAQKQAFSS